MTSTRTRTQARKRAKQKLLAKLEGFLDALTDYEALNVDDRRSKAEQKRERAIEKANAEYDEEINTLDDDLAEVIARMREAGTAEEVRESTGLSYAQQKTLLARRKDVTLEENHAMDDLGGSSGKEFNA